MSTSVRPGRTCGYTVALTGTLAFSRYVLLGYLNEYVKTEWILMILGALELSLCLFVQDEHTRRVPLLQLGDSEGT